MEGPNDLTILVPILAPTGSACRIMESMCWPVAKNDYTPLDAYLAEILQCLPQFLELG
jgi:hypothetical protein